MIKSLSMMLAWVFLLSSDVFAQTNLETNAGIQFNFSTPGAGNLALGGAFLALADDASAAYTNPAGLTKLFEDQVVVEVRDWSYTHIFTDHGRLEGRPPTGLGIDTVAGIRDGEATNRAQGLAFLAYVYPRKKWSWALYRHTLANFEANFSTQGAFLERTRARNPVGGFPINTDGRLASLENSMSLEIINHGLAVAYRLAEGFSLGLGLSHYEFSLSSMTKRFLPPLVEAPDFDDQNVTGIQAQTGEDSDWGLTVGLSWQISPEWSLGGVYRRGAVFEFTATSTPGVDAHPLLERAGAFSQQAAFRIPDVFGVGLSFSPSDRLRISLDYDHVEYSTLVSEIVDIFGVRERFDLDPELEGFRVDDADEIRLGVEYGVPMTTWPIYLRLGAWHESDHSLYFEGEAVGLQAIYRSREDQMHYTAGIGLHGKKYQLDIAVDHSERLTVSAISIGWRF